MRDHWLDAANYPVGWGARAQMAATFIPSGSHVLDIGAGARLALRDHLPPDCRYTPSDMKAWTPDVIVIDLEKDLFPDGRFDIVVMLGVLEYLSRPSEVLKRMRRLSERLLISYCHPQLQFDPLIRQNLGWVTAMRQTEFVGTLEEAGWRVADNVEFNNTDQIQQIIYNCFADPQFVSKTAEGM